MARSTRWHFIGMDTHSRSTSINVQTDTGRETLACTTATTIPALVEVIEKVRRPRLVVFEEGSLADWLLRNLKPHVDRIVITETRRNAYIAKDGDKDDAIDARKLVEVFRGGNYKEVHHPESQDHEYLKVCVAVYHRCVRDHGRAGNYFRSKLKRFGIVLDRLPADEAEYRRTILPRIPAHKAVRENIRDLLRSYLEHGELRRRARRRMVSLVIRVKIVNLWQEVPGIGPVRAATLYAFLETYARFRSDKALDVYTGIGLRNEGSGEGRVRRYVAQNCNRLLRGVILGAARRAIDAKNNAFYEIYRRCITQGSLSPKNAQRVVARKIAATLLSMWKHGTRYDARRVECRP